MIRKDFDIARLIAAYLSGEITQDESIRLDAWRNEDKSHEQLFQKICSEENFVRHEVRKSDYDVNAGWKGVEKRIKRMSFRKRYMKVLQYAATIILPGMILVFALLNVPEAQMTDNALLLAEQQILPGSAKAILTLDNGETVYLDTEVSEEQARLADKQIQVDSTTLNYRSAQMLAAQTTPIYNKVEIPQGGEYALVLNDGTKVHLNSMSSLRFPVTFGADKREVELVGEAYFEVSTDRFSL